MVNEDILGGLRSALARGQPLQKAKLSFFNAGYSKQEIEEAANSLSQSPVEMQQPQQNQPQTQIQKKPNEGQKEKETSLYKKTESPIQQPQQNQPIKKSGQVSSYGEFDRSGQVVTIILVTLLLLLVGILAAIFFFRDQLVDFLGGLLS